MLPRKRLTTPWTVGRNFQSDFLGYFSALHRVARGPRGLPVRVLLESLPSFDGAWTSSETEFDKEPLFQGSKIHGCVPRDWDLTEACAPAPAFRWRPDALFRMCLDPHIEAPCRRCFIPPFPLARSQGDRKRVSLRSATIPWLYA
jgi:hypothetical protein